MHKNVEQQQNHAHEQQEEREHYHHGNGKAAKVHKDSPTKKGEEDDDDVAAGKCSGADPSGDEDWCTPPSTKYERHGAPWPALPETKHVAVVRRWGPL